MQVNEIDPPRTPRRGSPSGRVERRLHAGDHHRPRRRQVVRRRGLHRRRHRLLVPAAQGQSRAEHRLPRPVRRHHASTATRSRSTSPPASSSTSPSSTSSSSFRSTSGPTRTRDLDRRRPDRHRPVHAQVVHAAGRHPRPNDDYWGEKPQVGQLRYTSYNDNAALTTALTNGEAQWGWTFIPDYETTFIAKDPEHYHQFAAAASASTCCASTTRRSRSTTSRSAPR